MSNQSSPASVYYVPSSGNQKGGAPRYYAIGEFPGSRQVFRCECKAGQHGRRCWHVDVCASGAVRPARLKGAAPAALVAAPAPEPKPAPAPERDRGFIPHSVVQEPQR